jgi:hypothetical protein
VSDTSFTQLKIPRPPIAFVGPDGTISREWLYLLTGLLNRTGGNSGTNIATVQAEAQQALATANTASATADTASVTANAALTAADAASAAVIAETARAEAAEALRALINNPTFTGSAPIFGSLFIQAANDAAAAVAGVVVGQFYANGSVVQQRQS